MLATLMVIMLRPAYAVAACCITARMCMQPWLIPAALSTLFEHATFQYDAAAQRVL